MPETVPSICRICNAHCPILVTLDQGRVSRVTGDPDAPLYDGYTCPKGRALPEQHAHPGRLLHSVKRNAEGGFDAIASERATDEVAERVQRILDTHGPRSVAMYVGTNALPYPASPALGNAWLRAIGSPMFFTSNTIDQPGKQIAAALHGGWMGGEHDFETSDTWLLTGLNPLIAKSAGIPSQNPGRRLTEAVERGMALIVIDPRRSETARRAHIHLQPRPGEDPSILACLLQVIFAEGIEDAEFLAGNAEGVDALRAAVAPFTPEYVARRAGVSAEQLREAARCFAGATRGNSTCGTGPNMATHGNLTEYLSLCLNSVCGRWARAGELAIKPNVMLPPFTPRAQPYPPYTAWGRGEKLRVRGLTNSAPGMPTAALADEILLEGEGQVKALVVLGGNPMMAWPDQRKTERALRALDLLVTLDVEMSATARLADYVIAPRLTLETPGMSQPAEGLKYFGLGIGYARPFAQYSPRIVEPPAGSDVIEEWEFFYGLAQRMNLQLQMVAFFGWGRHVESPPNVFALDMQKPPTTESLYEMICRGSRVSLDEVKRHPHGHVFEEVAPRVESRDPECTDRLQLGSEPMLEELAQVRAEGLDPTRSPADLPFRLVPRRANQFLNSSGRSLPKLTGKRPYNPAYMHSEDLDRLGLASGDRVRIRSRHDSILGVVEAEDDLRPGVVSMTHAFGANPSEDSNETHRLGGNTGRLLRTDDDYDRITGIPRMGAVPVAIEAIDT